MIELICRRDTYKLYEDRDLNCYVEIDTNKNIILGAVLGNYKIDFIKEQDNDLVYTFKIENKEVTLTHTELLVLYNDLNKCNTNPLIKKLHNFDIIHIEKSLHNLFQFIDLLKAECIFI